jgi:hypothetical protein
VVRTIKASHRLLFEAVTDSLVEGPAVKAKEEGLEVDRLLGAVQDYYDETSKDQPDRGRLGTAYGDSFLFVMDSVHRGLGRFSVGSTPAAQILVDGKDTGRWTPVTAAEPIEVPVGDHTLVLRTADRRTVTKKLTVAADEATTLETVSDFK